MRSALQAQVALVVAEAWVLRRAEGRTGAGSHACVAFSEGLAMLVIGFTSPAKKECRLDPGTTDFDNRSRRIRDMLSRKRERRVKCVTLN